MLDPPRQIHDLGRQLLREEELAATLDVVAAAALSGPTSANQNNRNLVAPQERARRTAVPETVPHKRETVRFDVESTEAARQHTAQLVGS